MSREEAQKLQIEGRYSELLRAAVAEQVAARDAGRAQDELDWTIWAAKACRFIGRTYEGMAHAVHAAQLAARSPSPDAAVAVLYVQALLFKGARQPAAALGLLDQAIALLPEQAEESSRAAFELERAELCLDAGRANEARIALARAAARVQWIESTRLLAWTMYLRSHFENPVVAAGLLTGAQQIAAGMKCPELEWHIQWKLAVCMSRIGKRDAEEDCARRALGLLRGMASTVSPDDAAAFWRQGARGEFVEYFSARFPSSAAPRPAAAGVALDPAVLPGFVLAALGGKLTA